MNLCARCKKREIEVIDDWRSVNCIECNSVLIDQSNRVKEWDYYHPGEPCPKSERDGLSYPKDTIPNVDLTETEE